MNQFVIIEKLKEVIADRSVKAAVFYTYNFNAQFFENYLLTTFLPHVNFSDNEIQNTILWRKYGTELPDITVYCDFHAKSNEAPNLQYTVRTIDLPTENGVKACFHPKVSFILLQDDTLIVLTGSNNLTEGGWCSNKEIVAIEIFKNGENFPYSQKHQFWDFLKNMRDISGFGFSNAEDKLNAFYAQRSHTSDSNYQFYHSVKGPFLKFISNLKENEEEYFQVIEIISPYISTGDSLLEDLRKIVADGSIYINVPYKAMDEADIAAKTYNSFQQAGVKWSKFKDAEKEKGFRFNHSKVYRLKTNCKMYTVVGSVNFTDAAWRGRTQNGNIETAIVYTEPLKAWEPWLEEFHNNEIVFSKDQGDETKRDERVDVPDFQFELNWHEHTLKYKNLVSYKFQGKIIFTSRSIELKTGVNIIIDLDDNMIDELVNNPAIRVKQYHTQMEFFYYPIQIGLESKPLPYKLRLKDNELIELWEHVSIDADLKSEITELIEKYISARMDKEGNLSEDKLKVKSTINMMASHISALIRLEKKIFTRPKLKRDYVKAKELLEYYLFTSNIDTLTGYRMLLQDMYDEKMILPGVYWFLLNLLNNNFYDVKDIKSFYKDIEEQDSSIKEKVDCIRRYIDISMKGVRNQLKDEEVNMKLLDWINANL